MGKRSSRDKPGSLQASVGTSTRGATVETSQHELPELLHGAGSIDAECSEDESGSSLRGIDGIRSDGSSSGSDDGSPADDDFSDDNSDELESDEDDEGDMDAAVLELANPPQEEEAALDVERALDGRASIAAGSSHEYAEEAATQHEDPASSSSEDEGREMRNTVGEVPLEWYKHEEHIGYDKDGGRLIKQDPRDKLDQLLDRNDAERWRTVYDEYNDEEVTLTKEEMQMIRRIRAGQFPHVEVDPHLPEDDWFTRDLELHPLSSAPVPKRRFQPSKWEEKKIVKLVRALRRGWIKRREDTVAKPPETYLMWEDDLQTDNKTSAGLTFIPAPKSILPGHEASYNPPKEYLPTEEERQANELMDPEDRPDFMPTAFESLRQVPSYAAFIKERFERCLDLYLCPRVRQRRLDIKDPKSLLPQLPKPKDLMPFPQRLAMRFLGHSGPVTAVAVHSSGQWVASSSRDSTVRVWEVATGRCTREWRMSGPAVAVAWCPDPSVRIVLAATKDAAVLLALEVGDADLDAATVAALQLPAGQPASSPPTSNGVTWQELPKAEGVGLMLPHQQRLTSLTWHSRGDYFATVAPAGNTQAVMVHQLSKKATQNPFRKNKGRVVAVAFHPKQPLFFVASSNHVRVYNLVQQQLVRKLLGGAGRITSVALHPSGDHLITGAEDKRVSWYDMDLDSKPYRALRYHRSAVRGMAFHRSYPLFASSSDDGTAHVFHGMVYQDLMTNPLIVPVKILKGHEIVNSEGVLALAFHPRQPWLFTAGADASIYLFTD